MINTSSLPELSRSEWIVMHAVWDSVQKEEETTAGELLPRVRLQRDWHFSTLKTTLERLVKKGYLASRIRGNTCFYRVEVPKPKATAQALTGFIDLVLAGELGPLASHLEERRGLSRSDSAELERLLVGGRAARGR